MDKKVREFLSEIGRKGGSKKSARKTISSRLNGLKNKGKAVKKKAV